jgi:hypothetical protein
MDDVRHRARFDWLVEVTGAAAAGLAAGFAALKLAPSFGFAPVAGMTASGLAVFSLGLLGMRMVKPDAREHAFAEFSFEPIGTVEMMDAAGEEPLLLDVVYEEPAVSREIAGSDELLLDDPLVVDPASRVVQLFAGQQLPTAGQLKERIEQHLAARAPNSVDEQPVPDASAALYAALTDLRRSLR